MSTDSDAHSEAYDAKRQRIVYGGNKPWCPACSKYRASSLHARGCPKASVTDAIAWIEETEKWDRFHKERAAFWLNEVRKMHGKLAMLKQENNQLRKKLNNQFRDGASGPRQ